MLSHPSKPGHRRTLRDELVQLLAFELANGGQVSLVNRLDRETSGLILVAKTREMARWFSQQLQAGEIKKRYLAILRGQLDPGEKWVNAPLLRQSRVATSRVWLRQMVHPDGAPAQTCFRARAHRQDATGAFWTLADVEPITGRTHQIRVHAAAIGHPLLGDKLYPDEQGYLDFIESGWTEQLAHRIGFERQALHAAGMRMMTPEGEDRDFQAPFPPDLEHFWNGLVQC